MNLTFFRRAARFRRALALALLFPVAGSAWADSAPGPDPAVARTKAEAQDVARPHATDFLKRWPADIRDYGKTAFRKEHWKAWALIAAGTALLLTQDQFLVDRAHEAGDRLHITHTQYQKTILRVPVPGSKLALNVEGPFDSGSALYFLGDGWTDIAISGSFLGYGLIASDNRALQTSSQIVESIFASGTIVQAIKHVTGHESPFTATAPDGRWRPFPNQFDYAKHTPSYDAYPTGHLCAAMATVTVIADNYPEKTYIRPLGYTLMTVLGFQMLNNGVHWASDYPLGIAIGYSFGQIAYLKGRGIDPTRRAQLRPVPMRDGGGVLAIVPFGGRTKDE